MLTFGKRAVNVLLGFHEYIVILAQICIKNAWQRTLPGVFTFHLDFGEASSLEMATPEVSHSVREKASG